MAEMIQPTAPSRAIPAAPGFVTAGLRIFDLSLGEMLWSRRTIFMLLVVGAPVADCGVSADPDRVSARRSSRPRG